MTWNIRSARGLDNQDHLTGIAEVINRRQPDIVALQEIDSATTRNNGRDLAGRLAEKCSLYVFFSGNIYFQGGKYGTAILSRFQPVEKSHWPLPNAPGHEQRGLQRVVIELAGRFISIYNTHLDHHSDDSLRFAQTVFIDSVLSRDGNPVILAGDLNDTPGSRSLKLLSSHFQSGVSSLSFPVPDAKIQIDYIFAEKNSIFGLNSGRRLNSKHSDHFPLFAEFFINRP